MIQRFQYMKQSLIFLLAFIGGKMLLAHHVEIPISVSLGCIAVILAAGIIASVLSSRSDSEPARDALDDLVHTGLRTARRIVVATVGATVLVIGLAMLVLPGPGLLVVPFGLAILASEFVWARRWLAKVRGNGSTTFETTKATKAVVLLFGAALLVGAGWALTTF
jgi:tellurite resistance protein TerC